MHKLPFQSLTTTNLRAICYGKVNEDAFVQAILELKEKVATVKQSAEKTIGGEHLLDFLIRLIKVACCRIYLHLIMCFRNFLNFEHIDHQEKQEKLLKIRNTTIQLLMDYEPKFAKIIMKDYFSILPHATLPKFTSYAAQIRRLIVIFCLYN